MRILVSGGKGQVAGDLVHSSSLHELIALSRAQFDVTDKRQILNVVKEIKPDVVINAAAYTAVDKAEQEWELAFAVNDVGAGNLARVCAEVDVPLIHLSTDYVFSGQQQKAYLEDDAAQPINVYGASKLAGEQAVKQLARKSIILRVSGVFGAYGNNFVKTMVRLAQEREELKVVADQIICPTASADITKTLFVIAERVLQKSFSQWGIYHFCSNEPTHWHLFAEAIIAETQKYRSLKVKKIQAITTTNYPTPAKRPAYSVLSTQKIQQQFAIVPRSWRLGLSEMLKELYS